MASSLNGTGVTFNDGTTLQSGNIPAANLGSGTANVNTVLRGNRTFGAPPAPTTAQVLSATAGASTGAVGTYAFLALNSASNITLGSTHAGSSLRVSGGTGPDNPTSTGTTGLRPIFRGSIANTAASGTWRSLGQARGGNLDFSVYGTQDSFPVALFLRIS